MIRKDKKLWMLKTHSRKSTPFLDHLPNWRSTKSPMPMLNKSRPDAPPLNQLTLMKWWIKMTRPNRSKNQSQAQLFNTTSIFAKISKMLACMLARLIKHLKPPHSRICYSKSFRCKEQADASQRELLLRKRTASTMTPTTSWITVVSRTRYGKVKKASL